MLNYPAGRRFPGMRNFFSCMEGTAKMVAGTSTRRSDEELEIILHETANWTVMGFQGRIFCEAASLRLAIDKFETLGHKGRQVSALIRIRPTKIMVFPGQILKLANYLAELEPYPIFQVMEA
jgi:hypothetical protein